MSLTATPHATTLSALQSKLQRGAIPYIVIDPIAGDLVPDLDRSSTDLDGLAKHREAHWQRQVLPVPLPEKLPLAAWQAPYLLMLHDAKDALLDWSVEQAIAQQAEAHQDGLLGSGAALHPVGGWLQSSRAPESVAQRLADLLKLRPKSSQPERYLRLTDPRVFALTCHTLGASRVSAALGPIASWHYLSPWGELGAARCSQEEDASPLAFSAEEWQQMRLGERIHRSLAQLHEAMSAGLLPLAPSACYPAAIAAQRVADEAARRWPERFLSARDFAHWASLHILYGDQLAREPIQQILRAAPDGSEQIEPIEELMPQLIQTLSLMRERQSVGEHA